MPEHVGAAFDMAVSEAWRFAGQTAPNPAVGCVLLDARGEVLVIAAHHKAGALHAERLAVEQAHALGVVERIHTAVVTLEPCNHTGRTPPCTEALLSTPVQTVWIGCADPNPHVPVAVLHICRPKAGCAVAGPCRQRWCLSGALQGSAGPVCMAHGAWATVDYGQTGG